MAALAAASAACVRASTSQGAAASLASALQGRSLRCQNHTSLRLSPPGLAPAHSARRRRALPCRSSADGPSPSVAEPKPEAAATSAEEAAASVDLSKEVSKAVKKTAATFAPRASTKTRNPAVPGSTLYTVFETQAYVSMALGGLLSYNLIFPSNEPDIWRLMGMWSVWMFTIPSLRARDCSDKEKAALNYLFLAVPLINVTLPLLWKSFAAVWTADVIAFFVFYAWKMDWLKKAE